MRRFVVAFVFACSVLFAPSAALATPAQGQDAWAWFGPATADGSPRALALIAFRAAAELAIPQDFVQSELLTRDLLLSVVTRGVADLSPAEMESLARELVQQGRTANPGQRFATVLRALGPGYEKIGQFIGNRPEIVPEQYRAQIGELRTRGRGMDGAQVQARFNELLDAHLAEVLGEDAEGVTRADVVEHFELSPLGTGSVGQAHLVRLSNGRVLVFKMLKPNVRAALERNFSAILDVLSASGNVPFGDMIRSIRDQTLRETDLRDEAQAIDQGRRLLQAHGINVPRVVDGFVSEDYMLMELAPGTQNHASLTPAARAAAARSLFNGVAFLVLSAEQFHGDPHGGNMLVEQDGSISLIDWGLTGQLSPSERNALVGLVGGMSVRSPRLVKRALRSFAGTLTTQQQALVEQRVGLQGVPPLKALQQLIMALNDEGVTLPSSVIQASRALSLAEGTAREIDPTFASAQSIRALPRMFLRARMALRRQTDVRSPVVRELIHERRDALSRNQGQHGQRAQRVTQPKRPRQSTRTNRLPPPRR